MEVGYFGAKSGAKDLEKLNIVLKKESVKELSRAHGPNIGAFEEYIIA